MSGHLAGLRPSEASRRPQILRPALQPPARSERARRTMRWLVVRTAAALLSGPGGLASCLRTGLLFGPAASPSLLLDVGAASDTIPAHLRRAVTVRDRHCRFPGCEQPPAACQPHHLTPGPQAAGTA